MKRWKPKTVCSTETILEIAIFFFYFFFCHVYRLFDISEYLNTITVHFGSGHFVELWSKLLSILPQQRLEGCRLSDHKNVINQNAFQIKSNITGMHDGTWLILLHLKPGHVKQRLGEGRGGGEVDFRFLECLVKQVVQRRQRYKKYKFGVNFKPKHMLFAFSSNVQCRFAIILYLPFNFLHSSPPYTFGKPQSIGLWQGKTIVL